MILNHINSNQHLIFVFVRSIIIYIFSILILRFGNSRFHLLTPFDYILPIILGSLLSRGINGSASLISTLISSAALIILHWLFAFFAYNSSLFGTIVKGKPQYLIQDNKIIWEKLRVNKITIHDLEEECRQKLNIKSLSEIKEARLERNGSISFIRKNI